MNHYFLQWVACFVQTLIVNLKKQLNMAKSYGIKTKKGNVASVTFENDKKPSKKVIKALSHLVDIAFNELSKKQKFPNPQ